MCVCGVVLGYQRNKMLSRVRDHSNYAHMAMHVCIVLLFSDWTAVDYCNLGHCTFRYNCVVVVMAVVAMVYVRVNKWASGYGAGDADKAISS